MLWASSVGLGARVLRRIAAEIRVEGETVVAQAAERAAASVGGVPGADVTVWPFPDPFVSGGVAVGPSPAEVGESRMAPSLEHLEPPAGGS